MPATDLRFLATQPASLDLRFGLTPGSEAEYFDLTITASLPANFAAAITPDVDMAVNRAPGLRTAGGWQDGTHVVSAVVDRFERKPTQQADVVQTVTPAVPMASSDEMPWRDMPGMASAPRSLWGGAMQRPEFSASPFGDLNHGRRSALAVVFQNHTPLPSATANRWKSLARTNRPGVASLHEDGSHLTRRCNSSFSKAQRNDLRHGVHPWGEAIPPQAGISPHTPGVVNPEEPGCYTPPPGTQVALLFTGGPATTDLLFKCPGKPVIPGGQTVVVPVKRAYIVINNVNLRRASDNVEIPCYNLAMNLDTDSWTWSFNATLHHSGLPLVETASYGAPVELDIEINGAHYRVLVESISRDRQFGNTRIAIGGRGKSAVLADPYSPILTFSNSQARTAQQLMNDALMDNGVSIGWEVDFGIEDWLVPAGVFSHNGSYMSAVKTVAEAAGGYVQPDPVLDRLYVKPRYPAAPWNWGTLPADYSLPAAVTARESIVWADKADYNGVYVLGQSVGVNALVKKVGSAGDYLAPMIIDPLITDNIAARQRGLASLGQTGRMANVTLSLPVLPETGIITPGKVVDYVDGGIARRGITRAVSVNVTMPTVRQTIEVETHVY